MPTLVSRLMIRSRAWRSAQALMQFEDFADLLFHRMQRVERGHRLLENHGDVVAAHLAQVALVRIAAVPGR